MQKTIPIAILAVALLFGISALAANKVVVVPLGSGAEGTDGQLQYNDNGRTAGADLYYDSEEPSLTVLNKINISNGEGFGVRLLPDPNNSIPGTFKLNWYQPNGGYVIFRINYEEVNFAVDIKVQKLNVRRVQYDLVYSEPGPCTSDKYGLTFMNNSYELCVCKPLPIIGSAYKKVGDLSSNCF